MKINRVVIKNFKIFENLDLEIKDHTNILVGNNGTGKSTFLEAIYLCLTGRLENNRLIDVLSQSMFSKKIREQFESDLAAKNINFKSPDILIEVYFDDEDIYAKYKGTNNSKKYFLLIYE